MQALNPDLRIIESIFNPKEEDSNNDGMFIHRNLNIAPFYKEYK